LPVAMPEEQVATGAKHHLTRINNKIVTVREGYEIISGVRVIDTPGHTPGHISLEVVGGDGLVIAGDALTHILISFQYPSWKVPVDPLNEARARERQMSGGKPPFVGSKLIEEAQSGRYSAVAFMAKIAPTSLSRAEIQAIAKGHGADARERHRHRAGG